MKVIKNKNEFLMDEKEKLRSSHMVAKSNSLTMHKRISD